MADSLITIQLEGALGDNGDVRLSDFLEELSAIKNALRQTERVVIKSDEHAVDYRIVKLSQSSPARVTLRVAARDPIYNHAPRKITRRFNTSLRMVRRGHRFAALLDSRTLEAFQAMNAPTKKNLGSVTVIDEREQQVVVIDQQFERGLNRLLDGDERERDEIVGKLERLDIHNKTQFDIYPIIGATRIRCTASKSLHKKIVASIGQWVTVDGWAIYRKDSPFPHAMKVEDIFPRKGDEELPLMTSLHGIAPDATEGKSPEDFIRDLRDAYW